MNTQNHNDIKIDNLIHSLSIGERSFQKIIGLFIGHKDGQIEVEGFISNNYGYRTLKDIPKTTAKLELDKIKDRFDKLLNQYEKLRKFISNYQIDYYLVFDSGGAGVVVCAYLNGIYKEYI